VSKYTAVKSVNDADIWTGLDVDYKTLERRVDALRAAHLSMLKIAKVCAPDKKDKEDSHSRGRFGQAYENEGYDYPTQVNESITVSMTEK
jgi:hypothetical protein